MLKSTIYIVLSSRRNPFQLGIRYTLILYTRNSRTLFLLFLAIILVVNPNFVHGTSCCGKNSCYSLTETEDLISVQEHRIEVDIKDIEHISVLEKITYENKANYSVSTVNHWINNTCQNITVQNESGNLMWEKIVEIEENCLLSIDCTPQIAINETETIYIHYNMEHPMIIEDKPSFYHFELISALYYQTVELEVYIKLPEKSYITEEISQSYFPENPDILQIGTRTLLIWYNSNLPSSFSQLFFVRFNPPIGRVPNWFFIIGPIIGLSIGVGITLWVTKKREKKVVKKIGEIFLNESQKKLLQSIKENGGKIQQKELIRKTEFTRSKTSRNLITLEEQGLIRKEKWGRNYVVYITKTGEKVIE
jgi:uncharacterized membrane protein